VERCTVLVVEDDRDTREMLVRFLELEGYRAETAANGREALDRLVNGAVRPAVIVLDLMMPVMDGWQFRQEQSRHASLEHIPVIVVSAAGRERMMQIEAQYHLAKPLNLDELLDRISDCCRVTR
jgi:CheY-like chemotaxis protein